MTTEEKKVKYKGFVIEVEQENHGMFDYMIYDHTGNIVDSSDDYYDSRISAILEAKVWINNILAEKSNYITH